MEAELPRADVPEPYGGRGREEEIKDGGTQVSLLRKQAFTSTEKHPWEARLEMRIEKGARTLY